MKQITKGSMATVLAVACLLVTASPFKLVPPACAPIKVTVDGEGYLRLSREGRAVYAKSAVLTVSPSGKIATESGDTLLPTIAAPIVSQSLQVDLEGNVFAVRNGSKAKIGRLVLALFPEGTALDERDGIMLATERPKLGNPGEETNGVIRTEAPKFETKSSSPIGINTPKMTDDSKVTAAQVAQTQPVKPAPTKAPEPVPAETKPTPAQSNARPKISGTSTAEVVNDKVTLGDILVVEAEPAKQHLYSSIEIGEAPAFGAKRVFERARILGKMKLAGIKEDEVDLLIPASITVTRKGQSIPHSEFVQAALKAVYEASGIATEYVADDAGPEFVAPAGPKALVVETISGVNTAVATIKVAVYVGPKRINSRTLTLRAKALPVTLKSGAPVKVVFRAGGAMVEVSGIAKNAGKTGDSILVDVRLPGSDKTSHSGILLANGSVEVKL